MSYSRSPRRRLLVRTVRALPRLRRRSESAEQRREADAKALRDMRQRGERRRHATGLHLPDVLLLEVHATAPVRAELGHREALLLTVCADPLADLLRERRFA